MAYDYVDKTIAALSAGQAAGTDPVLAKNQFRNGVIFRAASDFEVAIGAGATSGQRVYASARDGFEGEACPANALYLVSGSGLAEGDALGIWEA